MIIWLETFIICTSNIYVYKILVLYSIACVSVFLTFLALEMAGRTQIKGTQKNNGVRKHTSISDMIMVVWVKV